MGERRDTPAVTASAGASRSMRFRLFALIAAVMVPAAIAFTLVILDLYRHDRVGRERQLLNTARATAAAVDANVGQGWSLLEALANSDEMAAEDWSGLDRAARRIAGPGMSFLLLSPDRGQLLDTRTPRGALSRDLPSDFAGDWRVLQRHPRLASDVFIPARNAKPIVALDLLVRRNGRPAYVLSLLIDPSSQARLLANQRLPPGWIGGLMDRRGVVIARSPSIPGSIGQPGTPDMVAGALNGEEGVAQSATRAGEKMVVAYARTASTGWTTVVAAPRAELEGDAGRSFGLALILGLIIIVGGMLLALSFSRRLLSAMYALEAQAEALGDGLPTEAVDTGLLETDRVSRALAHASAERQAHDQQLDALNASLEARVTEATDRLVQAQKMEALGQLTGGLAHDFNNLLTAVLGNLALIRRTELNERQARFAENARAAGERGARLTQQLLAFSRRQRLTPEILDLAGLVEETRELIATTLGAAVRLVVNRPHDAPLAMADRTQLELAMLNLAINARDAMPDGGELTITITEQTIDKVADQEGAPAPGRYAAIAIRDNGMGMPSQVRKRVFEPFFTTKGPGQGSGLGMSQALGMARQLGGGMLVESKHGAGTTVTLLLPLAGADERTLPQPLPQAATGADLGGLKVLLVDDDEAVRAATLEMLSVMGCLVTEAADGKEALAVLPPDVDLVLADFAMPEMNGAELAQRLSAIRPGLPVLLITGFADPIRVGALWRGPVLSKPFDIDTLATAVRATAFGANEPV